MPVSRTSSADRHEPPVGSARRRGEEREWTELRRTASLDESYRIGERPVGTIDLRAVRPPGCRVLRHVAPRRTGRIEERRGTPESWAGFAIGPIIPPVRYRRNRSPTARRASRWVKDCRCESDPLAGLVDSEVWHV